MAISPGYSSNGIQASSASYETCYDETEQAYPATLNNATVVATGDAYQPTTGPNTPNEGPAGDGSPTPIPDTRTPHTLLDVRGLRLANDISGSAGVYFRINNTDDTIVYLAPGDSTIVKCYGRITKLQVKGATGAPVWSPCIYG